MSCVNIAACDSHVTGPTYPSALEAVCPGSNDVGVKSDYLLVHVMCGLLSITGN